MSLRLTILAIATLLAVPPAIAQSANAPPKPIADDPMLLAQAADRCMATYAVKLSKTAAADDAIYDRARAGCGALNAQLVAALRVRLAAGAAATLVTQLETSAKPNFMTMLAHIRADRKAAGSD